MKPASSERSPTFYAWCDEASRFDAFAAALSALVYPGGVFDISVSGRGISDAFWRSVGVDEAIAKTRPVFQADATVDTTFGTPRIRGAPCGVSLTCYGEALERRYPCGPLRVGTYELKGCPHRIELALGDGPRSVEAEAALVAMQVEQELATHPYRTLWPLWADALFVLGLMT